VCLSEANAQKNFGAIGDPFRSGKTVFKLIVSSNNNNNRTTARSGRQFTNNKDSDLGGDNNHKNCTKRTLAGVSPNSTTIKKYIDPAAFFFEEILQISGIITPWQTFTLIMRVLGALLALTR
jgi:hypothetical protein